MPTWLLNFLGGPIIQKLLDFIPDPAERARQQFELQKAAMEEAAKAESDQRTINAKEAGSSSMFVAGWRPAVGWLCVSTLAYMWLFLPLLDYLVALSGHKLPPFPVLDSTNQQTLLYALLGIGGLRTLDKIGGVDTTQVGGVMRAISNGLKAVVGGKK